MKLTTLGAVGAIAASSVMVGLVTAPAAFASTTNGGITISLSSPYEYYTSSAGVPQGNQGIITGSGFQPNVAVYIETCNGLAPTSPNYTVAGNCFNANAGTSANAQGNVTINTPNANYDWSPFHGEDPLDSYYNCLAPSDNPNGTVTNVGNQPIDNTLPSWGASTVGASGGGTAPCQLRISQNYGNYSSSDIYIPLTGLDQNNPLSSSPSTPEAPLAVLLPVGGVVLLAGGALVVRRRRHRSSVAA